MIKAFKPGAHVKFLLRWKDAEGYTHLDFDSGALCIITDRRKTWDWKVPGYLGDGFYEVLQLPEGKFYVAHEDDLFLVYDPEKLELVGRTYGASVARNVAEELNDDFRASRCGWTAHPEIATGDRFGRVAIRDAEGAFRGNY
jgi:hypothetical protein